MINLTCLSTQFVRWVIHVPLVSTAFRSELKLFYVTWFHIQSQKSAIEGPDPVIQDQRQDNSSALTYILTAQVPLWRLKGTIRCEVSNNSELYAEVFIATGIA